LFKLAFKKWLAVWKIALILVIVNSTRMSVSKIIVLVMVDRHDSRDLLAEWDELHDNGAGEP
jgi:hypothetical protein